MNRLAMRAVGAVLGILALVATAWLIKDRFEQKRFADAARDCAAAAADPGDSATLTACLPQVRSEVIAARRARLCESALLPRLRPETRFAMAQTCGAGTKRLVAESDAAAAAREALAAQLAQARADLFTAVARAERRAVRSNEREANGRKVIDAAPRDAAGAVRCDAECLRRIAR